MIIVLVNYMLKRIDDSKALFSIDELLAAAHDPEFPKHDQDAYAESLVEGMPVGKALDAMIELYRSKSDIEKGALPCLYRAIKKRMSESQHRQFINVVSQELATEQRWRPISSSLNMLDPSDWPLLTERARIRIQQMMERSVNAGALYSKLEYYEFKSLPTTDESKWILVSFPKGAHMNEDGVLGAYANKFWPHIENKNRFIRILLERETSDISTVRYILVYFMTRFPDIYPVRQYIYEDPDSGEEEIYTNDSSLEQVMKIIDSGGKEFSDIWFELRHRLPVDYRNSVEEKVPTIWMDQEIPF